MGDYGLVRARTRRSASLPNGPVGPRLRRAQSSRFTLALWRKRGATKQALSESRASLSGVAPPFRGLRVLLCRSSSFSGQTKFNSAGQLSKFAASSRPRMESLPGRGLAREYRRHIGYSVCGGMVERFIAPVLKTEILPRTISSPRRTATRAARKRRPANEKWQRIGNRFGLAVCCQIIGNN